ncbi:zinc-ribbon domain-containing protein [Desulfobacterales bacterium HSG2]|nr:zinc-ribbon domain-containing protein [Desulfobacterales bacterium HSG2]
MRCKKCGMEMADNAAFCIGCGTTAKNEEIVEEAPTPKKEPPTSEAESSQKTDVLPTPDRNDIADQRDVNQDGPSSQRDRILKVYKKKSFPASMFVFSEYDGMKALVFFIFVMAAIYFFSGIWTLLTWEDSWWWPDGFHKATLFGFHLFLFITAYCLAWLTFDKTSLEGYVFSIFSFVLGVVYIISPFDFVPDIIPVISAFDDALIGGGSIFASVLSRSRAKRKEYRTEEAIRMLKYADDYDVLKMLLEERGVVIEKE